MLLTGDLLDLDELVLNMSTNTVLTDKSKGKKKANGDAANGDAQVNGLGEPEVATPQPMTPPVQPAVSLVLTASPETPAPTQSLVVSDTILGMS